MEIKEEKYGGVREQERKKQRIKMNPEKEIWWMS